MSFKNYVQHMTHKYRLAVAVAVLKNKPENTSIEQYINQLQENIKENDVDDDLICSNDFNIDDADFKSFDDEVLMTLDHHQNDEEVIVVGTQHDDDNNSINILENFDVNNIGIEQNNKVTTRKETKTVGEVYDRNIKIDDRMTVKENRNYNKEGNTNRAKTENKTTLDEAEMILDVDNMLQTESDPILDVLRTIRGIEDNMEVENDSLFDNGSQATYFEGTQVNIDENMTFSAQEDYTIRLFNTDTRSKNIADNATSLNDRVVANVTKNLNKNLVSNAKKNSSTKHTVYKVNNTNTEANSAKNVTDTNIYSDILRNDDGNLSEVSLRNDVLKDKVEVVTKNINKANIPKVTKTFKDVEQQNKYSDNNRPVTTENITENATQDSQETIIYTLHGFTQNTGHISQSQCQNINIPDRYLFQNNRRGENDDNSDVNYQKYAHKNLPVTKDIEVTDSNNKEIIQNGNIIQNSQITVVDSSQIQYIIDQNGRTYAVLNETQINNTTARTEFNKTETIHKTNIHEENVANLELSGTNGQEIEKSRPNMEDEGTDTENDYTNAKNKEDDLDIDHSTSQQEIVPFKVVKELSKLKTYLNKRERINAEGFSSDSGYRSDSQHSSYKHAHLSDNWVHQSAHCLYKYVVQCPLVARTQDIVGEISLVLGKLIDRLHEEEKYPSFIEDVLGTVDTLLKDLYHSTGENILLEKDETIQRLLLLNKSSHILRYSIEKLTNILENIHTCLTSEETLYEHTNVQEVENLTYIFYILETLLQKYMKAKNEFESQSQSQEVKSLRKSSIADIWRKKWNSDFKENKIEGSQKVSILVKCGDILNKIIVDCIEGYSLVSFAALQCFNLIQN